MNNQNSANVASSIHQRLLNLRDDMKLDFSLILKRYAAERFLFRLSQSKFKELFILKGALIFEVWMNRLPRATKDIDFLGMMDDSPKKLMNILRHICDMDMPLEGLKFDERSIRIEEIREEQPYKGWRVGMAAALGKSKIDMQIDIGFGDAAFPKPRLVKYPTLLNMPAPRIRVYAPETAVAEKMEAIIRLDFLNSRMKDFYDLYIMSKNLDFNGSILQKAVQATFKRRRTQIPQTAPLAFTEDFYNYSDKLVQWKAFLNRSAIKDISDNFRDIIHDIKIFLQPLLLAASEGTDFNRLWKKGGQWE